MFSGIFTAEFKSNQKMGGCGIAVFSGNTIHGGDSSHYYRAKYRFDERNPISGAIDVSQY